MRMVQSRDRPRLPVESLIELALQDLDRNNSIEPGIARLVNRAHTARSQGNEDLVWAEPVVRRERHSGHLSCLSRNCALCRLPAIQQRSATTPALAGFGLLAPRGQGS